MKKILCVVCALLWLTGYSAAVDVGDTAPTFANPNMDNQYVLSRNVIGGDSWVLLDFFATYCEPCKEEIPELETLLSAYSGMDFEIFVFAVDSEGRSVLDPYFEERPTSLPVLIDRYKVAAERYGVEKLPTVFLVNPEGTIVYKAEGYKPENIEAIKSFLDEAQEQ